MEDGSEPNLVLCGALVIFPNFSSKTTKTTTKEKIPGASSFRYIATATGTTLVCGSDTVDQHTCRPAGCLEISHTVLAPQVQWHRINIFVADGSAANAHNVAKAVTEFRTLLSAQWSSGFMPHAVFRRQ